MRQISKRETVIGTKWLRKTTNKQKRNTCFGSGDLPQRQSAYLAHRRLWVQSLAQPNKTIHPIFQDLIMYRTLSSCHRRNTGTNPPPALKGGFSCGTFMENVKQKEIYLHPLSLLSQLEKKGNKSARTQLKSFTGHRESTCSQETSARLEQG